MIILFRMTRDITIYDTRRLCHALSLFCNIMRGIYNRSWFWAYLPPMRHWTWVDWLETNLLRSDWIFAQLDWAPKKGPATTRDWRTAVHTPSLLGLSMQPQNRYWHQLCTESSELSWISHWPLQNPQQFRYILFKYWCRYIICYAWL